MVERKLKSDCLQTLLLTVLVFFFFCRHWTVWSKGEFWPVYSSEFYTRSIWGRPSANTPDKWTGVQPRDVQPIPAGPPCRCPTCTSMSNPRSLSGSYRGLAGQFRRPDTLESTHQDAQKSLPLRYQETVGKLKEALFCNYSISFQVSAPRLPPTLSTATILALPSTKWGHPLHHHCLPTWCPTARRCRSRCPNNCPSSLPLLHNLQADPWTCQLTSRSPCFPFPPELQPVLRHRHRHTTTTRSSEVVLQGDPDSSYIHLCWAWGGSCSDVITISLGYMSVKTP